MVLISALSVILAGNQSSYSGGQLSSGYSSGYSNQGNMGGYNDYSEYWLCDNSESTKSK